MESITIGNKLSQARIEVGLGKETKVNLIVGVNSADQVPMEKEKIRAAAALGVHTIIDLSTIRLPQTLWQWGQQQFPGIAFGKVAPILVARENGGKVSPRKLLDEIRWSVEAGVDYMTLNLVPARLRDVRIAACRAFPTTSRQGGVLLRYMIEEHVDNPYNSIFDEILELFRQYRVTMHIGSTFRPSGITEAYDECHRWELERQMELYQRADEAGVQAIVEPFSHQPLGDIAPGIEKLRTQYGAYVPFQMLGPVVTDVNFDCDQYSTIAGAAIAAMNNVGKITTIPPREHVGFPTLDDTVEGIKATLTAVHAGDLCRLPHLIAADRNVAEQRRIRKSCNPNSRVPGCNKCGDLCPLLVQEAVC